MTSPISSQESIKQFLNVIYIELPIGGNNSINRIKAIYADMKKDIPDYKYEDLETLFELRENGKSFTNQHQELREKIYSFCQEALKKDKS